MSISIYVWGTTPRSPTSLDAGDWSIYVPFSTTPDGKSSRITIEEVVPGVGSARLELWDLTNKFTFAYWAPIWIVDNASGSNLFVGMVQKVKMTVVATYRLWNVDCVDINALCDTQLVGCPDGSTWQVTSTSTGLVASQPGWTGGVAGLFASPNWLYGVVSIDASTYADRALLVGQATFERVSIRSAANRLAALGGPLVTWWLDYGTGHTNGGTTCYLHWTDFASVTNIGVAGSGTLLNSYGWNAGGPLTLLFPQGTPNATNLGGVQGVYQAPYAITDGTPDYTTTWDAENVSLEADYSAYRFSVYVRGATDYTATTWQVSAGPPPTYTVGRVYTGGTGWVSVSGDGGSSYLSDFYDAPATNQSERNEYGMAAMRAMTVPVIRGTADLILDPAKGSGVKAFHAGQNLTVTSAPMGISGGNFFILRCTTSFLSGTDVRRVALQWGTAAQLNTAQRRNAQKAAIPPPARGASSHTPAAANATLKAGGSTVVSTQLTNAAGQPWAIAGKLVTWSCQVINDAGADVTTTTSFTLSPTTSTTDASGKASTTLMTSSTATGVKYLVTASTPD